MRSDYVGTLIGCAVVFTVATVECAKIAKTPIYNHVSGVNRSDTLDAAALLRAFAEVESSGRLHVRGDGGRAYGLYQFHRARWIECGGSAKTWGKASRAEQDAVMRTAIDRYLRAAIFSSPVEALVIWCGRYHNIGHGGIDHNAYTRKLWAAYQSKLVN